MGDSGLTILELKDSGDERGSSFPVPADWFSNTFPVRDLHITTVLPSHIRGNHYHVTRNEVLIVIFTDHWSLHWDNGAETTISRRRFDGNGTVVIRVPPHSSHAIRNDGNALLHLVGLTDGAYDPAAPDAFPREVARP